MRCPRCQTDNPKGVLYCVACHHRLFAWLGDAFGASEPPAPVAASPGGAVATAPATQERVSAGRTVRGAEAGFPWGKMLVGGTLLFFLFLAFPAWTAIAALLVGATLLRWPRMSGCAFSLLIVAVLVTVPVWTFFLSQPSRPRPTPAQATATAQAFAPTATARAQTTATARAQATARAVAAPAMATAVAQLPPERIYGPAAGVLEYQRNAETTATANVQVQDFIAEVRFFNPYDTRHGIWNYGIIFRAGGPNQHYRLWVDGNGAWVLDPPGGRPRLPGWSGQVRLDVAAGGSNHLRIVVQGDVGTLFVNGDYIAPLNLSDRITPGGIAVVAGLFPPRGPEGSATRYEGFTVWSVP